MYFRLLWLERGIIFYTGTEQDFTEAGSNRTDQPRNYWNDNRIAAK